MERVGRFETGRDKPVPYEERVETRRRIDTGRVGAGPLCRIRYNCAMKLLFRCAAFRGA